MTAVLYARYSSDNQREESIEGQTRECTAFAEKNGTTTVTFAGLNAALAEQKTGSDLDCSTAPGTAALSGGRSWCRRFAQFVERGSPSPLKLAPCKDLSDDMAFMGTWEQINACPFWHIPNMRPQCQDRQTASRLRYILYAASLCQGYPRPRNSQRG